MHHLRLAYRDVDRTPVIFAIAGVARQYYDLEVEVLHVQPTNEYESAIFDGTCDVIIEHTDYLLGEPYFGRNVILFCAPSLTTNQHLVVASHIHSAEELAGGRIVLRAQGNPHTGLLTLRAMGLQGRVDTVVVPDRDVGRWAQWKMVQSGECVATFVSPLYLDPALDAGLKILPSPKVEIIGQFAQACRTGFAAENPDVMDAYMRANLHALYLLVHRRDEALRLAGEEPMRLLKRDAAGLDWFTERITSELQVLPYPTVEAVKNWHETTVPDYPGAANVNPLTLWDLHWVKQLDDEGFLGQIETSS